jgi:hypothetical protein
MLNIKFVLLSVPPTFGLLVVQLLPCDSIVLFSIVTIVRVNQSEIHESCISAIFVDAEGITIIYHELCPSCGLFTFVVYFIKSSSTYLTYFFYGTLCSRPRTAVQMQYLDEEPQAGPSHRLAFPTLSGQDLDTVGNVGCLR